MFSILSVNLHPIFLKIIIIIFFSSIFKYSDINSYIYYTSYNTYIYYTYIYILYFKIFLISFKFFLHLHLLFFEEQKYLHLPISVVFPLQGKTMALVGRMDITSFFIISLSFKKLFSSFS